MFISNLKNRITALVLVLLCGLALVACEGKPVVSYTPLATNTASPTSEAKATDTPTPTLSPTSTPEPTATSTPTPTSTPAPTLAPDPYNISWWIENADDSVLLTAEQVYQLNQAILAKAGTEMYDMLEPGSWTNSKIYDAITAYSFPNKSYLDGKELTGSAKNSILAARNLEALKADGTVQLRYAVVTSNAALRSFPTSSRISDATGRHDYFQETGLNIGEPLIVLHDSADGKWCFVQALTYRGWVNKEDFGFCSEEVYNSYVQKRYSNSSNFVVASKNGTVSMTQVAGPGEAVIAMVNQAYIREGTTLFASDVEASGFEFPFRNIDGTVYFANVVETGTSEKIFTARENTVTSKKVLEYAANLLGAPYSWGDEVENGTDCSSTMQSIYAIFGLWLPRNTSGQIAIPVEVKDISTLDSSAKTKYIMGQSAGTILYMPGHVMMLLGEYEGRIYILHNTTVSSKDDGTTTQYYSCVITSMDIGKTGKTLLDRCTLVVRLLEH